MSTYVLMRVLESAPGRYDLGMRLLSFGRIETAYDRLASRIEPGQRVLDVGTGTGALALRAARRGARVKAIDVSAPMLEIAARRLREAGLEQRVELAEMGVAELDHEPAASYDAVLCGLCLSELSTDERAWTLRQAARLLGPGGRLLVVDEVAARGRGARALRALLRAPLAALTYLVTQQTSHAVPDLVEGVEAAGLRVVSQQTAGPGGLVILEARRPGPEAP